MNDQESRLGGMLTGLALASVQQWSRWDDDTQRRIRDVRGDTNNALHQVRDLRNSGPIVRLNLPVVNDAQVGLAMALAESITPQIIPIGPSLPRRPDIAANMENAVADLHWPPTPGVYTPEGAVKETGELTATFLAMTFEEVRAILQGSVQEKQPKGNQKVQIYRAINSLIATLYKLDLTWEEFAGAWERVFNGGSGSGSGTSAADPHTSVLTPPTASSLDPVVMSVIPLGQPEIPAPWFHQNTDKASKWRVSLGVGNIGAGQPMFAITFGAPGGYIKNGKPYMPVVAVSPFPCVVESVTNQKVVIKSYTGMAGPTFIDVSISSVEG